MVRTSNMTVSTSALLVLKLSSYLGRLRLVVKVLPTSESMISSAGWIEPSRLKNKNEAQALIRMNFSYFHCRGLHFGNNL